MRYLKCTYTWSTHKSNVILLTPLISLAGIFTTLVLVNIMPNTFEHIQLLLSIFPKVLHQINTIL